jgi:diaminohydroxyphosphoribosylaminopyrimidine deaminase/5-amino-6-(5-phosphoribosylamino)uracil reductase
MLTPLGAMRLAIQEARKGLGFVAPNPAVGCVILDRNGDLISKGFHRQYGAAHAEVEALLAVQSEERLRGAIVYVTLEPCAHEGQTPSCAKRLATLPLAKVVYGLRDPNPLVDGQGAGILRSAGIEVEEVDSAWGQDIAVELEELAEIFTCHFRHRKTFVALKVATSLDGQMAHQSGESKWITGEEAREQGHFLRATYDAVLIGAGTFFKDDPRLDVRHPRFSSKANKVVILDATGDVLGRLAESNIFKTHKPNQIFLVTAEKSENKLGVNIVPCSLQGPGQLNLNEALTRLFELRIGSILVEGGAAVISSFLVAGLAQRIYQFIAPQIIGAKSGLSYTSGYSTENLAQRIELLHPRAQLFGKDVMVTGRLDQF